MGLPLTSNLPPVDRRQDLWSEAHQALLNPGAKVQLPAVGVRPGQAGVGNNSLGREQEPWERVQNFQLAGSFGFDRGLGLAPDSYGSSRKKPPRRNLMGTDKGAVAIDGQPQEAAKKAPPIIDPKLSSHQKLQMAHAMAAHLEERNHERANRLAMQPRQLPLPRSKI